MNSTQETTRPVGVPHVVHPLGERRAPHRAHSRPDPRPEPAGDSDEAAFLAWLAGFARPGSTDIDGPLVPGPSFTQLLGRLTTSRHALPPEIADAIGMGRDAVVGDVATELLIAVNDPAGPRCRSYRAAVYYRQGDPGPLFTS